MYRAVDDFYAYVARGGATFKISDEEYREFRRHVERAQFFLGPEITDYIQTIEQKALKARREKQRPSSTLEDIDIPLMELLATFELRTKTVEKYLTLR